MRPAMSGVLLRVGVAAAALTFLLAAPTPVRAGGFLGDMINVAVPGLGTKLDEAHRDIGKPLDVVPGVVVAATGGQTDGGQMTGPGKKKGPQTEAAPTTR